MPYIPEIIAQVTLEGVYKKHFQHVPDDKLNEIYESIVTQLVDTANSFYNTDKRFQRDINAPGNRGRDLLYVLMKVWALTFINEALK